jgi:hypothetical protein
MTNLSLFIAPEPGVTNIRSECCTRFITLEKVRHEGVSGELKYSSMNSLTSAPAGGEWSASRPGRFTPRERASGTYWIGGWVGPRAFLDTVVKRKIPSPRQESNPTTLIVQPVAQRYTD